MFRKSSQPLDPRKTLTESVYERLKDDIIDGPIKPGESLSTLKIARDMGVSPMPVRAALTRLEAEGLVRIEPQRGVVVTSISPDGLEEAFAIRSRLEGLAVYLACAHITRSTLKQLKRSMNDMRASERHDDVGGWLRANQQFHQVIFDVSQKPRLKRLLLDMWSQARRGRIGARNVPGHMKRRNAEHETIVKALEDRDADLAERLMRDHILMAGIEIVQFIAGSQRGRAANP